MRILVDMVWRENMEDNMYTIVPSLCGCTLTRSSVLCDCRVSSQVHEVLDDRNHGTREFLSRPSAFATFLTALSRVPSPTPVTGFCTTLVLHECLTGRNGATPDSDTPGRCATKLASTDHTWVTSAWKRVTDVATTIQYAC